MEVRVLDAIASEPGVTRATIAAKVGVDIAHIQRPITNLLHAGKITREGHKALTRYRATPSLHVGESGR
jgi:predicted transcriptional regulator